MAVDERGEDVMSDEIGRRGDRKQHCCVTPDTSYEREGAGEVRREKVILLVKNMGGKRKEKH